MFYFHWFWDFQGSVEIMVGASVEVPVIPAIHWQDLVKDHENLGLFLDSDDEYNGQVACVDSIEDK